jgi:Stress responsive A/B Barrel Domain
MTLRHVVLFGFGEAQSPAAITEVIRRFAALKDLVPGIDDFEWGENSSPEGLNQGHSHAFLLTFANSQARDAYLVHPDHAAFGTWVQPFVSRVTVLDYQVEG